ncbi:L-asparaginase/GlutRNAGln amidotransferase subunit D [Polaromonas sp. CF318]|uniref:asparaginase n=1 Tax=Polaromonas sp. CF318 TaxID=1144318 RepID=UPI000270F9FA|nr:asparaginase [Polaromonas sp. CF318]EJL80596.1 L-asparaginase/GlutRNAGln amidotransferase subunit D [Polaromonas sp. CF318]
MHPQNIVILGTGGTIAGRAASASDNIGYTAAQVGVEELLAAIPGLAQAGSVLTEQVAQVDSKDMTFAVWAKLAARVSHYLAQPDIQGIVITHGTDTLEETAFFLQALLAPAKPVVLTCAMRPATALVPDGPQNLLDAVAVARHAGAQGVVAVCAGVIHGAADVQKVHTYKLDPFSSGDAGPIGYVEEGQLRLLRCWPQAQAGRAQAAAKSIAGLAGAVPRVEIIMNHAGAGGAIVQALQAQGVQGLVVAGTGNGSLHHELQAALLKAQADGVKVIRASRCASGRVLPTPADAIPDSEGLSPVKARVSLILQLLA